MSDFDSNPFADPDFSNPFQDPAVTQATRTVTSGLEEYNPFTNTKPALAGVATKMAPTSTQPAIMKLTEETTAYAQSQTQVLLLCSPPQPLAGQYSSPIAPPFMPPQYACSCWWSCRLFYRFRPNHAKCRL